MHEHLNSKNRRSNVVTRGCRILKTLIRHIKSTFLVHTIQILLDYFLFDLRWIKNVAFAYILFCSLKMNSWKTKTQLYMRPDFDFLYPSLALCKSKTFLNIVAWMLTWSHQKCRFLPLVNFGLVYFFITQTLSQFANWLNESGHISHTTILYILSICLIYLPMDLIMKIAFKEYHQMNVNLYTWYCLGGCFGGLIFYWVLIMLYYKVFMILILIVKSFHEKDLVQLHFLEPLGC